jgi:hypothetical protein
MMSLMSSMRHMCIVDEITDRLIPGIFYASFCCLSSTVGHGETCGVCELGLDGRRESRGDCVFTLACTPGISLEPAFVIRTMPCNDTYLLTYHPPHALKYRVSRVMKSRTPGSAPFDRCWRLGARILRAATPLALGQAHTHSVRCYPALRWNHIRECM